MESEGAAAKGEIILYLKPTRKWPGLRWIWPMVPCCIYGLVGFPSGRGSSFI